MDGKFSYFAQDINQPKQVAQFLKNAGFKVKSVHESQDEQLEDGSVDLKDGRHIQVGYNYFMVYSKPKSKTTFGYLIAEINGTNLADLLKALKKGK